MRTWTRDTNALNRRIDRMSKTVADLDNELDKIRDNRDNSEA